MNRILIVCQQKKRQFFEEALQDFILAGAEVYFAHGDEAISLLEEKKPQLIFAYDQLIQENLSLYQKQPHLILLSDQPHEEGEYSNAMKKKQVREICNKHLKLELHHEHPL